MKTETGAANRTESPKPVKGLDRPKKNTNAASNGKNSAPLEKRRRKGRKMVLPQTPPRTLRTDFGLRLATFAKMTGVSQKALAEWEQDEAASLDDESFGRIGRVAHILVGLARVMRRAFIPTWIEQPNDACKEVGAGSPLDLFKKGDYETLEDMVWYLKSGTPS